jgi:hypothetical protein
MADDEGAEGRHHCKGAEALSRCKISTSHFCELMDAVDITRTHERKTVLMNWSIGRKAVFVRLLARERKNEVAPLTGDEKFSYSSLAGETLTWVTGERPGKLTYAGPDVFYGIGLPHSLFRRVESELGKCKVSHEAVDMGLQEYPYRLRLDTMEKRVNTIRGTEGRCEPFSEKLEDLVHGECTGIHD